MSAPAVPRKRLVGEPAGLQFDETLEGWVSAPKDGDFPQCSTANEFDADNAMHRFRRASVAGRKEKSSIRMRLTIKARLLDRFISDPYYRASITGGTLTLTIAAAETIGVSRGPSTTAISAPKTLEVTGGEFCLLRPEEGRSDGWIMQYSVIAQSDDGRRYDLEGFKSAERSWLIHAWPELSTLYTTVYDDAKNVVALGILRISFPRFLSLLRSMHVVPKERRSSARLQRFRFISSFLRRLLPIYGPWPLGESAAFRSIPAGKASRPMTAPLKEVHYCHEYGDWDDRMADDVWLRLRRYGNGTKGPVMVTHGLLMSTAAYLITTIDQNLTEYLVDHGYDVWLFDYRASTDLPSALSNFTLDDIATADWPEAVGFVKNRTGRDVEVVGHCMGSLTLQMALLADSKNNPSRGLQGVRAAVCSQVTVHVEARFYNRMTAALRVAKRLQRVGFRTIQPETTPDALDWLIDLILRLNPFVPRGQRCSLAVCHWVTAFCGPTHRHEQLNLETHRNIVNLFGPGDLKALKQIARIIRHKTAVSSKGADDYLPNVQQLKDLPILFLAGDYNRIFPAAGARKTHKWLQDNGCTKSKLVSLPQYAHLDGFIGENSSCEIFPIIEEFLAAH